MVVRQSHLQLVAALLVLAPGLLALLLLKGESLVLGHDRLMVGHLASLVLIFEHATHAKDSLFLVGPILLLLSIGGSLLAMLAHLLVCPLALQLSIALHPRLVAEVLALELAAAGDVLGLGLTASICPLLSTLHFPSKIKNY